MYAAFVSGIPVSAGSVQHRALSCSSKRDVGPWQVRNRSVIAMKSNGENPKLPKLPQGFTPFSEELNGRVAMLGFILAIATELLNPEHPGIAAQIGSIFDVLQIAHAMPM